jgi:hypothetical protein
MPYNLWQFPGSDHGLILRIMRRLSQSLSANAQRPGGGCHRYLALFGLQTIGAVIIFWNGVPLYRQALADPASHQARLETLIWSLAAIALIQTGYWISYRLRPPPPKFTNALIGHILSFLARMAFVFAASVFGFVFITQKSKFHIPVFRYVVTLAGLFSLYCYVLEIERLGGAFVGREVVEQRSG